MKDNFKFKKKRNSSLRETFLQHVFMLKSQIKMQKNVTVFMLSI